VWSGVAASIVLWLAWAGWRVATAIATRATIMTASRPPTRADSRSMPGRTRMRPGVQASRAPAASGSARRCRTGRARASRRAALERHAERAQPRFHGVALRRALGDERPVAQADGVAGRRPDACSAPHVEGDVVVVAPADTNTALGSDVITSKPNPSR